MSTSGYDSDIQIEEVEPQEIIIAHPMKRVDLRKVERYNLKYNNPRKRVIAKPDRRFPAVATKEWYHESVTETNLHTSGDLITYNRNIWREKFLQSRTRAKSIKARYRLTRTINIRLKRLLTQPSTDNIQMINSIQLTSKDFKRLQPNIWLSTTVIEAYLSLLMLRPCDAEEHNLPDMKYNLSLPDTHYLPVAFMQSLTQKTYDFGKLESYMHSTKLSADTLFQYASGQLTMKHHDLPRESTRVNLFKHDIIFLPLHKNNHWILIVININESSISAHCSKGWRLNSEMTLVAKFLHDEAIRLHQKEFLGKQWKISNVSAPLQTGDTECGVFLLTNAAEISLNKLPTFTMNDTAFLRLKIKSELLTGSLMREEVLS